MIEAIALNKFYGSRQAVKNLSFTLERGGLTGFLGGNGAGKSTTMRMLAGYLAPSSGTVRIAGFDLARQPLAALKNLGYLPENNPLYRDLRVREFLTYRAKLKEIPRAKILTALDGAIENCWLREVENQIIGQLSKGYRQRVGLADCLLGDPPLLILDEPTVGLDPNQIRQTRALIRALGESRTVFLSTHLLNEVELLCARVIIIERGEIVGQGEVKTLCADAAGEKILRVRLSAAENPRADLSAIAEITEIIEESFLDGAFFFRLRCGRDPRREIARISGEKNYLIEEMLLETPRLDDVFHRLTGKNAAAASLAKPAENAMKE